MSRVFKITKSALLDMHLRQETAATGGAAAGSWVKEFAEVLVS